MRASNDNLRLLRPDLPRQAVEDIAVRPACKVALFTRHTLASYLGVHVNTIDRLVARGEIAAYRVAGKRRFDPHEIERYINRHREEPR